MNWYVKLLLRVALLMGLVSPAFALEEYSGMAMVARTMPAVSGGYRDLEFPLSIADEFWRSSRSYVSVDWRYAGVANAAGSVRFHRGSNFAGMLTFEIAGIQEKLPMSENCSRIDSNGGGVQCVLDYPWEAGVNYSVKVSFSKPNTWTARLSRSDSGENNADAGSNIMIGSITVPASFNGAEALSERVEAIGPSGSGMSSGCPGVPSAMAIFRAPRAEGGSVQVSSSKVSTSGPCSAPVRVFCSVEQHCVLSAVAVTQYVSSSLFNEGNRQCLTTNSGEEVHSVACTGAGVQAVREDPHFRFVSRGICLQATAGGSLSWTTCNDSAAQRWVMRPSFMNVATGKCLAAQRGTNQPVKMERCDHESLFHFWR